MFRPSRQYMDADKVKLVREIFEELGGDLDQPDMIPAGAWGAVRKAGVTNTKWVNWLQPIWCPHLDEVAVQRAMRGEAAVIENLTHFEWDEFMRRLLATTPEWVLLAEADGSHEGTRRFGERWDSLYQLAKDRHRMSDKQNRSRSHGQGGGRRLAPEQVRAIRASYRGGSSMRSLSREHGVAVATISDVVNRASYADVA